MKRFATIILLTVIMGVIAAGCGNITGNQFVGNWVNSERAAETLEITRTGDSFTVTQSTPTIVAKIINNGEKIIKKYPATFKDGLLILNTGSETSRISYVKDGDHLLFEGHKFVKQK